MSMTKLFEITLGAGGGTSLDFINIPADYTDLMLVASTRASNGAVHRNMNLRVNGSTTGYSEVMLDSNGSSASSAATSGSLINWSVENDSASTANTFSNVSIYIPNYAGSGNKHFSMNSSGENNATTGVNRLVTALWSNSAAITGISLLAEAGSTFVQHSSATLYGISKVPAGGIVPKATGGEIYQTGAYTYHVFKSSGTFTPTATIPNAEVLCIAGGGGGSGAGGGAGGYQIFTGQSLPATGHTVTVGSGGAYGVNGVNSQFAALTASVGGGYGGSWQQSSGGNGGSGGGGAGQQNASNASGGIATTGQGYNGGGGWTGGAAPLGGGGGGGAGGAGTSATDTNGRAGGIGSNLHSAWLAATSTGVSGYIAAGGGGGGSSSGAAGGNGGGGLGALNTPSVGVANTGSGGGGSYNMVGAAGGSGIVIIRYA